MIRPPQRIDWSAVADHYDDLDRLYREIWGEHVHHGLWLDGDEDVEGAVLQLIDRVAAAAGVARGDRVCDIGCGYGGTARRLSRDRGSVVTGLTLSRAQQAWAETRARPGDRVTILVRDWLDNGLDDEAFDAAVAIESTEHMADLERCFAEAARVLRPGGRLAVCAWLVAERPGRWQIRHLLEPICREGRLPGLGSESEYRAFLDRAGFEAIAFDDLSRHVARTWTICIRRCLSRLPTDRALRRYLFSRRAPGRNRAFLLSLFRLRAAYLTGAMRYGLFVARRPHAERPVPV